MKPTKLRRVSCTGTTLFSQHSHPIVRLCRAAANFFDGRVLWFAAASLLIYFVIALRVIASKPLWSDEIFTIYLCRLPDMASVWRALSTGLEQMPPFAHVVSRTAYRLAGGGAFAIRLPSVLGFATMAACLYVFLRKRLPAPYALASAAAFPFPRALLASSLQGACCRLSC